MAFLQSHIFSPSKLSMLSTRTWGNPRIGKCMLECCVRAFQRNKPMHTCRNRFIIIYWLIWTWRLRSSTTSLLQAGHRNPIGSSKDWSQKNKEQEEINVPAQTEQSLPSSTFLFYSNLWEIRWWPPALVVGGGLLLY